MNVDDELALRKKALRRRLEHQKDDLVQAVPTSLVERHPLASTLGATAGGVVLGRVLGGSSGRVAASGKAVGRSAVQFARHMVFAYFTPT